MCGGTDVVKLLLAESADVNAADEDGYTALMGASLDDHHEVVKILLEHGAQMEAKDNKDKTALKCAQEENKMNVVEVLIKHGAEYRDHLDDTRVRAIAERLHAPASRAVFEGCGRELPRDVCGLVGEMLFPRPPQAMNTVTSGKR